MGMTVGSKSWRASGGIMRRWPWRQETGESVPLPCAIMAAGDDAAALEASLIENVARLDPDEVTRWECFTRLVREGRSSSDIAETFGLTELQVRRTLALGNLLPRIRNLYRRGDIEVGTVRHLTLASKAQQRDWLALLDDPTVCCPTGMQLKAWLFGGASIPTTAALFDLTTYEGGIVSDLFGEGQLFRRGRGFLDRPDRSDRSACREPIARPGGPRWWCCPPARHSTVGSMSARLCFGVRLGTT